MSLCRLPINNTDCFSRIQIRNFRFFRSLSMNYPSLFSFHYIYFTPVCGCLNKFCSTLFCTTCSLQHLKGSIRNLKEFWYVSCEIIARQWYQSPEKFGFICVLFFTLELEFQRNCSCANKTLTFLPRKEMMSKSFKKIFESFVKGRIKANFLSIFPRLLVGQSINWYASTILSESVVKINERKKKKLKEF